MCVCGHLRLEVLQGAVFGFCWSWQSLSLMLIVSSGASRHTKIQLGDKSVQALKIQHFISAWLLRKLSANTFPHSFPLAAEADDDFNLGAAPISSFVLFLFWYVVVITALILNIELILTAFLTNMPEFQYSKCWIFLSIGMFLTCHQTQKSNACSHWWTSSQWQSLQNKKCGNVILLLL